MIKTIKNLLIFFYFDYDCKEIAYQITIGTHYLFKKISNLKYLKYISNNFIRTKSNESNKSPNLCSNLLFFLNRFNCLSFFIKEEIISYKTICIRTKAIKKCIDIA